MHLYATFEDKGYAFQAHIPSEDGEPIAFELRILIDEQIKYALLVPMIYVPTFGVDVGDAGHLESVLDRVLQILPPATAFDAKTLAALDALESEIGGKRLREQSTREREAPGKSDGEFQYVGGLFAQSFADLLGGRAAMDHWMQTRRSELGNRTPAEALHLGMVREVLELLAAMER